MKQLILLFLAIMLCLPSMKAHEGEQDSLSTIKQQKTVIKTPSNQNSFWKTSKIFYGGGLGVTLNRNYTSILIAPEVGYRLFKPWSFAISLRYAYSKYKDSSSEHCNNLGFTVNTKLDILPLSRKSSNLSSTIIGYGAYRYDYYNFNIASDYASNGAYVGIGLRQHFSQRSSVYLLASWRICDSSIANWGWQNINIIPEISAGIEF